MQDESLKRAWMLFGILVGMAVGLLSLVVPAYVGASIGSGAAALLTLAGTWMLLAFLFCRWSPDGFDGAWPGLVGITFPLTAAAAIVPQWPEADPEFRWVPLLSLAVGVAGLAAGVAIEKRVQRRPAPRKPTKALADMPPPLNSGIRSVVGWLLLTIYLGAWAIQFIADSTPGSVVPFVKSVGMGTLSMLSGFRTWTAVKEWRAGSKRQP